ncbi:MAG TPA: class IV adenylate cyclase [Bacteroidota bacterium]|nr:class IV adenylate cyclase [Bacteroidota bacterium]
MPQNLELKVPIASLAAAERIAHRLGAQYAATLHQKDTYYNVKSGRLKLREILDDHAELIYYRRPNICGGKYSQYTILSIDDPKTIHDILMGALGTLVVVQKKRRLYLFDNARIHLDHVKELGTFLEFEVVIEHGKPQARALFQQLCKAFCIQHTESLQYSYCDLLLQAKKKKN